MLLWKEEHLKTPGSGAIAGYGSAFHGPWFAIFLSPSSQTLLRCQRFYSSIQKF